MNYLRDLQVRQMPVASLTPHASNPQDSLAEANTPNCRKH